MIKLYLLAFMLFTLTGGAVSANEGGEWRLEEVIVTSQKREQRLIDVPISIVSMNATELEDRRIGNLEDLGLAVPGLDLEDNGPFLRRIYIRGVGNAFGSSSLIGLYLDEASVTGDPVAQIDLRPYDLERVEVLRGPQGTLYGEGSAGGTIRFITKAPQLDSFSVKANMAASFTEDGAPGQKIQGMLNIPLIEDELGLRVAGTFENAGGWIDQPAASQSNINDQNVVNVRTKLLWQPVDALEVSAMALIHRNDAGAPNVGEDDDGNFTQTFNLQTTPSVMDDYNLYNLTLSYEFASARLLSTSTYLDADKQVRGFGNRPPLVAPPPFPSLEVNILSNPRRVNIFSQELRLNSVGSSPWQWTVGGFYRDAQVDSDTTAIFALVGTSPPLPAPVSFLSEAGSKSWAVFGNTSYALTERFEIGAGVRYFEDDRTFFDGTTQTETFDSTTPRVYASYAVSETANVYVSAAKGFRSGGFNQLGQPSFDPESIWTYELGTKMSLLDGRVSAEVALFYSDYSDYQVVGLLPPPALPLVITSNAGDASIKGIELSLSWQAMDNLFLSVNGNYVDAEFEQINATSASHAVGDRIDLVPKYQYTLSAVHDFNWLAKPGFVRLDYNQRGRAVLRNRSIYAGYKSTSDVINMLNLDVSWEWSNNLSFGLFAQNLLDERGFIGAAQIEGSAPRTRPRTVGFEIGVEFD